MSTKSFLLAQGVILKIISSPGEVNACAHSKSSIVVSKSFGYPISEELVEPIELYHLQDKWISQGLKRFYGFSDITCPDNGKVKYKKIELEVASR